VRKHPRLKSRELGLQDNIDHSATSAVAAHWRQPLQPRRATRTAARGARPERNSRELHDLCWHATRLCSGLFQHALHGTLFARPADTADWQFQTKQARKRPQEVSAAPEVYSSRWRAARNQPPRYTKMRRCRTFEVIFRVILRRALHKFKYCHILNMAPRRHDAKKCRAALGLIQVLEKRLSTPTTRVDLGWCLPATLQSGRSEWVAASCRGELS